jgi:cysteine dioxygenase
MDLQRHSTSRAPLAPPQFIPLQQFVGELERMSKGLITKPLLEDFMLGFQPNPQDLEPYKHWSTEKHTRNKIFRNDMIECMLICWPVAVKTPLHTHNGQLGWMSMIEGRLMVENFRLIECNAPENQQVVGIDCLTGATYIKMEKLDTEIVNPGGPLNTVDKTHTIHRISNPAEWNQPAVSLHVYSRPIESCVVFDLEAQRCFRRDLKYDF